MVSVSSCHLAAERRSSIVEQSNHPAQGDSQESFRLLWFFLEKAPPPPCRPPLRFVLRALKEVRRLLPYATKVINRHTFLREHLYSETSVPQYGPQAKLASPVRLPVCNAHPNSAEVWRGPRATRNAPCIHINSLDGPPLATSPRWSSSAPERTLLTPPRCLAALD